MNKAKQAYLWRRFSKLLPDKSKIKPENSCMFWGFDVGDGWYELIKELMTKLDELRVQYPKDFKGFRIAQVKEKFGGLRFYVNHYPNCGMPDMPLKEFFENNPVERLITKAEQDSYSICEDCGQPGKLRNDRPWIRTLCDKCSLEDLERKKRRFGKLE